MAGKAKKRRVADDMLSGMKEALAITKGSARPKTYRVHIPEELDVAAIRKRLKLTQAEFANRYGFKLARIRDWEQGRFSPDEAMRAFLIVIDKNHRVVNKTLRAVAA